MAHEADNESYPLFCCSGFANIALSHPADQTLSWLETGGNFTDLCLSEFLNLIGATLFQEKSFYRPCSNFVAILSLHTKCLDITTNLFDDFCLYYTHYNNCRKGWSNAAENYLRHILAKKSIINAECHAF